MDISDIELVIVYGVPDGMNQLYQVPEISICTKMKSFISVFFLLKLCGRAGRGDLDARSHIFIVAIRRLMQK